MKRRRGLTLVELIVATSIAMIIGLVAASLFRLTNKMAVETTNSYLISRDLEEGVRMLMADLRETALASVRPYPPPGGTAAPGLSLVSGLDDHRRAKLGEQGQPVWQRWVYYTLEVQPNQQSGTLHRWEEPVPAGQPGFPTLASLPSSIPKGSPERVVFHNVAAPQLSLDLGDGTKLVTGPQGGFVVQFLRADQPGPYQTSAFNPAQATTGQAQGLGIAGNTRLVQLRLTLVQASSTGKLNMLEVPLRVSPRY